MYCIKIINTKGESLTKKRKFTEIAAEILQIIHENGGSIDDVDLMIKLEFTPESWKTWKPQLIQLYSIRPSLSSTNSDGEYYRYKIIYRKKERKLEEQITVEE